MATRVKTLRLPEDVIETIEQFPGESFTDKFVTAARLLGVTGRSWKSSFGF